MFRLAYKSDKLRWNGNIILNEQSQLPIWLFIKLFAILQLVRVVGFTLQNANKSLSDRTVLTVSKTPVATPTVCKNDNSN